MLVVSSLPLKRQGKYVAVRDLSQKSYVILGLIIREHGSSEATANSSGDLQLSVRKAATIPPGSTFSDFYNPFIL